MIIEYFTQLSQKDIDLLIEAYHEALDTNQTTFDFNNYLVTTSFAGMVLKYNDIDIDNKNEK